MTIAAEATEAKAVALIVELRRCLAIGVPLQGRFLKDALAQLESATTNSLTARVDYVPSNLVDGRDAAEVVVIT